MSGSFSQKTSPKKRLLKAKIFAILVGVLLGSGALWVVFEFPEKHTALVQQLMMELGQESLPPALELDPSLNFPAPEPQEVIVEELLQETLVPETEPPSKIKKHRYVVQVARCLDQICVEDFQRLLKYAGFSSNVKTILEATPVFEVASSPIFTARKATRWVQKLNDSYRKTGTAFREHGTRYLISLGLYPDQRTARQVQADANFQLAGELVFYVNPAQQKILYYLVRTGNFERKEQAAALQKRLKSQLERSKGIWVVKEPNL